MLVGGCSVCTYVYVCKTGQRERGVRVDCPWYSPLRVGLNKVISRPLCPSVTVAAAVTNVLPW